MIRLLQKAGNRRCQNGSEVRNILKINRKGKIVLPNG